MRIHFIVLFLLFLIAPSAFADKYFGIYPNATLSDVKSIYPNASFLDVQPAWMKNDQRFITITGSGIEGSISVLFYNDLETSRQSLKSLYDKQESGEILSSGESLSKKIYVNTIDMYTNDPNSDPWLVDQIRWSPVSDIKLQKFVKRYGNPDKEDIDENMNRYKVWNKSNNIMALVNDKDMISLVIYSFSAGDYMCSQKWKEGKECNPKDYLKKIPSSKLKKSKK